MRSDGLTPVADIKSQQVDTFIKARKEPSFEKSMQVTELSPQQAAMQVELRKVMRVSAVEASTRQS